MGLVLFGALRAPHLGTSAPLGYTALMARVEAQQHHVLNEYFKEPVCQWVLKGFLYPYFAAYVCSMYILGLFGEVVNFPLPDLIFDDPVRQTRFVSDAADVVPWQFNQHVTKHRHKNQSRSKCSHTRQGWNKQTHA